MCAIHFVQFIIYNSKRQKSTAKQSLCFEISSDVRTAY